MRRIAEPMLIGATCGWVGAAIGLAASGILNIGGLLPGAVIAVLWLTLIGTEKAK